MKKLFFTLMLSVLVLAGCDFFVDPVAYNDKVIALDNQAIAAYDAYATEAENTPMEGDLDALDKKRLEALTQLKTSKTELSALEGLKGDTELRDVFIEDLDSMIETLEKEEKELIELWKKMVASDEPADEDVAREGEILQVMSDRSDAIYEKVSKVQEAFAIKHGYALEPEQIQPK